MHYTQLDNNNLLKHEIYYYCNSIGGFFKNNVINQCYILSGK